MITVSDFYKKKFGCKVYKLALDAGCTCPTRDGTKSTGGCIFCSQSGSGDFAASRTMSITEQIRSAKALVEKKIRGKSGCNTGKYIAYFQNFTNTYGNPDKLERLWLEALENANDTGIVGIDIATRPDCLSTDIVNRLVRLSERTFLTVELGLQTANDETARKINRCYRTSEYENAVKLLHSASNGKIHVVTHIIFGLPDETKADMLQTVRCAVNAGTDGVKCTVLHVLAGTKLAHLYQNGAFRCLKKEEYFEIVASALRLLPQSTVVHRLTGDGDKKILIAPLWTANKRRVRNEMAAYLRDFDESHSKSDTVSPSMLSETSSRNSGIKASCPEY